MTSLSKLIRRCIRSRLARFLVLLHASWLLIAIANMSPPAPRFGEFLDGGGWSSATLFAGRPFHFTYESPLLKVLLFFDVPSMLVAALVGIVLAPLTDAIHVGSFIASYIDAMVLLLVASCQWLAVGVAADSGLESRAWGQGLLKRLNKHFLVAVVLIVVFAVVAVPVINKRSRQLGFRHGAISFH